MIERTKEKYGFADWPKSRRGEGTALLMGFSPWREDFPLWLLSFKESRALKNGRRLLRTVFDHQTDKEVRLLIVRYENANLEHASENLIQVLANNQVGRLTRGPDDLGDVSFMHPTGSPSAVFMSRDNVCLCFTSFGKCEVDVVPFAYLLDSRITDKPVMANTRQLEQSRSRVSSGMESMIATSLRLKTEEGYFKFFADSGSLFFEGDQVYIRAEGTGEVGVEVFAIESNGEVQKERMVIEVD